MLDERRKWIQKFLEMHEFSNLPSNTEDFYKKKDPQPEEDKPKDKKKDAGKKEEGKKSKKNDVEKFIEDHVALGPTEAVVKVQENVKDYSDTWGTRDSTEVSEEVYDTEMARDMIRPDVENEL